MKKPRSEPHYILKRKPYNGYAIFTDTNTMKHAVSYNGKMPENLGAYNFDTMKHVHSFLDMFHPCKLRLINETIPEESNV